MKAERSKYVSSVWHRSKAGVLELIKEDDGKKACKWREVYAVVSRWCKMQLAPLGIR